MFEAQSMYQLHYRRYGLFATNARNLTVSGKNDNHKFEGEDDEGCAWVEIVESTLLRDGTKETHNWKMYKYECEKCDFTISPRLWESDSDSDSDSSWGI